MLKYLCFALVALACLNSVAARGNRTRGMSNSTREHMGGGHGEYNYGKYNGYTEHHCPPYYFRAGDFCYRHSTTLTNEYGNAEYGLYYSPVASKGLATWSQAKLACEMEQADLVHGLTESNIMYVASQPFEGRFWIGLSTTMPNEFHWLNEYGVADLDPIWWVNEPNATTAGCVAVDLVLNGLIVQPCEMTSNYFYCQRYLTTDKFHNDFYNTEYSRRNTEYNSEYAESSNNYNSESGNYNNNYDNNYNSYAPTNSYQKSSYTPTSNYNNKEYENKEQYNNYNRYSADTNSKYNTYADKYNDKNYDTRSSYDKPTNKYTKSYDTSKFNKYASASPSSEVNNNRYGINKYNSKESAYGQQANYERNYNKNKPSTYSKSSPPSYPSSYDKKEINYGGDSRRRYN